MAEILRVEVDCKTGEQRRRVLTPQELQERKIRQREARQREQQQLEQEVKRQGALARVREDPTFTLLLEALGITACAQ